MHDPNDPFDTSLLMDVISIQCSENIAETLTLKDKFATSKSSLIFHSLGVVLFIQGDRENAKKCFLQGIGISPNDYFGSGDFESVGQCMSMLLIHYEIAEVNESPSAVDTAIRLTALAYLLLSKAIDEMPNSAYDSYRTRALLFKDHNYPVILNRMFGTYFEYPIVLEPFILSDFYQCSNLPDSPHKLDMQKAISAFDDFQELADVVPELEKEGLDKFGLEEMVEYGKDRHRALRAQLELWLEEQDFKIPFQIIYALFTPTYESTRDRL